MIENATLRNFRALRSVDVDLRPLTVLVGMNDSGKSSFLSALRCLVNPEAGIPDSMFWRRNPSNPISISLRTSRANYGMSIGAGSVTFSVNGAHIAISPWDRQSGEVSNFGNIKSALMQHVDLSLQQFQLPVQGISVDSPGYGSAEFPIPFGTDGSGLPSYLDNLLRKDRKRFFSIVEEAKRLIPGLEDFQIETPNPSQRRLDFVVEGGLQIAGDQASAGVRLLIFFIALLHHPAPPKVILIEEPETGIHPARLADVMKIFRKITRGELGGHAAQVIMTTHSPYLLDCVDLDTDQVLVFRREEDGSRTASPVDSEGLKGFLHGFQLGEIWFNEGEERLVAPRS